MNISSSGLPKPFLSLCMIVKNESENLLRCLASAKPYVDEIIVVDTGSEDETPDIARRYGAKVLFFEWCNDFAAARNYSISQATGHWILVLDADEELVVESENFFEKINLNTEVIAYSLELNDINDLSPKTPSYLIRLFRNLPDILYVNRFHEQLRYQSSNLNCKQYESLEGVKILHYGYFKEKAKQKTLNRNIPILEQMRQNERLSFMHLYCLAKMYTENQQIDKARECYNEAFNRLLPNLIEGAIPEDFSWIPSLLYALGMNFFEQNDYETARLVCQRGLEWCPTFPPLSYLAGVILSNLGFPLGAAVYFENCLQLGKEGSYYKGEHFDLLFTTTHPAYNLGLMYLKLKQPKEALAAFELSLSLNSNFTLAQEQINTLKG
ncbi:glycosyltransferase [Allocoleopsis sp.]|uniref:glycosyltransferase n=1 Tax=Allocoleopsis sp. TaxID=3088169 RepID=UPI002FD69066